MMLTSLRIPWPTTALLLTGLGAPLPALAQQSIWPDRAENLQELPADFTGDRLRAVMTGFSRALGVRCSHCHVGEEGRPLSTFNFVSDENPNKDRARAMLRMLGSINEALEGMELRPDVDRVNMWCHTCHAGKARPQTLAEAVEEVYEREGGAAAVAHFEALREEYYGGPAYDFRAPSVNQVASGLAAQGDTATALAFLELNVEHHPDYLEGWESLGVIAAAQGREADAIAHYERALELSPEHPRIQARLRAVRGGGWERPEPSGDE